jgi:phage gp45-like
MISLIRGIVTSFTSKKGKIARFSANGRIGETFSDREAFQHFGFASALPKGTEAILLKNGQNVYLIGSDNRKYRLSLGNGETAIYNEIGDSVHLKNNHEIEINATGTGSKVIVNASSVFLGGEALADGVVTGSCNCAYTGGPHPVKSFKVKAQL